MGCFQSKPVKDATHAVESGLVKCTPVAWGSPVGGTTPQGTFSLQVIPVAPASSPTASPPHRQHLVRLTIARVGAITVRRHRRTAAAVSSRLHRRHRPHPASQLAVLRRGPASRGCRHCRGGTA